MKGKTTKEIINLITIDIENAYVYYKGERET